MLGIRLDTDICGLGHLVCHGLSSILTVSLHPDVMSDHSSAVELFSIRELRSLGHGIDAYWRLAFVVVLPQATSRPHLLLVHFLGRGVVVLARLLFSYPSFFARLA